MTIRKLGAMLLAILSLIWFRVWMINQLFSRTHQQLKFSLQHFGIGVLLVGILFLYQYLLRVVGRDQYYFRESLNGTSISMFVLYLFGFLASFLLIFKTQEQKSVWYQVGIGIVSLLLIGLLGLKTGVLSVVMYYLISAYAEELLKFSLSHHQKQKSDPLASQTSSRLLLFSISIALAFSLVENFFAFFMSFVVQGELQWGMLLGRGLLASLIHLVSTGAIAMSIIKFRERSSLIIKFFFALLLGFGVHAIYNLGLYFQQGWVSVVLVIVGVFAMSYLISHLDELYEPKVE